MNVTKVNTLINSLDICSGGKNTVRQILEEVSGVSLTPKVEETYRIGQRFRFDGYQYGDQYILAVYASKVMAVNLASGLTASGGFVVANRFAITPSELNSLFGSEAQSGKFKPVRI